MPIWFALFPSVIPLLASNSIHQEAEGHEYDFSLPYKLHSVNWYVGTIEQFELQRVNSRYTQGTMLTPSKKKLYSEETICCKKGRYLCLVDILRIIFFSTTNVEQIRIAK